MDLINAKPRFALEGDKLFDYQTSLYIKPEGTLEADGGVWDLEEVARLIREGKSIETAFLPLSDDVDDVEQANRDFDAAVDAKVNEKLAQSDRDFAATVDAEVEKQLAQRAQHAPPPQPETPASSPSNEQAASNHGADEAAQ